MTTLLVTGASGFVGTHLLPRLSPHRVRLALRNRQRAGNVAAYEVVPYNPIESDPDYSALLNGVDVVVHLAGIAHTRATAHAHTEFNSRATARLAEESARHGIKRFIFLSTIKVHGQFTPSDAGRHVSFTADSPLAPQDDYSISKAGAEQSVIQACAGTATQYVLLRPPLVYGPGVRANFLQLMKLVHRRIPLPFSAINNRRSFIYVENLVDIIQQCLEHPAVANHALVMKDYDDSTPGLVRTLASAFGRDARLFPLAPGYLARLGKLIGREDSVQRLTESLLVDDNAMRQLLNWTPPVDTSTAFARTADWYIRRQNHPPAVPFG